MMQKIEYRLLADTDRWRCWIHSKTNLLVLFFSPCQYGWTKALNLSRDEHAIRYEIEKCGHTSVVFTKHPSMIKLEWDSIEVYCKIIQLKNSFWGESCVYICLWFVWIFIALVFIVWMNICIHEIWAVGINGWLLLFANGYSFVNARTLLLSCLGHWMSFMTSSIINVHMLRLTLNSI